MNKALVTGAAGFLGSNLVRRLIDDGIAVVGIDNFSMGRRSNLADLSEPAFTLVEGDVTDPRVFASLPDDIDCVVHLAAFKIPRYGKALDTLTINYHGTHNTLEFARRCGCKCVLASTSDVYGRNPAIPFSETTSDSVIGSPKSARWAYAVSKMFDEHLALAYQDAYEFPVTILRIFGSYGPRQHLGWWGGAPPVFIDAVLRDEVIPIHGDGSQTRSFTYVSDTVEGMTRAILSDAADGEIINIGSTHEVSILQLAQIIKDVSGTPGELKVELVPYQSFTGKAYEDVMRRVPDISLAERLLGFSARVGLEEGLRRTIAWQRTMMASGASSGSG